ncbi:hypothetical protein ABZV91_00685 [Nocardia sp. NPDC004568]|uniref:Uncharacterized protein n=1 Tax=Nocardia testacea TaxID=248551 RepID=A0ABW7VXK1_9NOCA|nr:hypothetical protein [Nocardia testacea]
MSEPTTPFASGLLPHLRESPANPTRFATTPARIDPAPIGKPANGIDMTTFGLHSGHPLGDSTRESAVEFVIDAIESTGAATRDDFDIDQIVTTAHALADDWDFRSLRPDTFWRVASTFIRA